MPGGLASGLAGAASRPKTTIMIDSPSHYGDSRPHGRSEFDATPPRANITLATEKISVDRKIFFLDLQENHRGRYVKVTEDTNGRRDTIILPLENTAQFLEGLKRIIGESDARPQAEPLA